LDISYVYIKLVECYLLYADFVFFFFFQAEDGIRDKLVTGVQTCALPISRLDQIEEEDVRHEVDRRRGVVQLVEEPHDARLRGHRQRDVDQVHPMRLGVRGQLVDRAQDRADTPHRLHRALGAAVIEESRDAHPEQRLAADLLCQSAAQSAGAGDDCYTLRARGGEQAQQQLGHAQVRRAAGHGRGDEPRAQHARVEDLHGARRPADEQQQRDRREPPDDDLARQRADRARARRSTWKGEREDDQRQYEIRTVEGHPEQRHREQQHADRDQRIDERHHLGRGGGPGLEELPLCLWICEQGTRTLGIVLRRADDPWAGFRSSNG